MEFVSMNVNVLLKCPEMFVAYYYYSVVFFLSNCCIFLSLFYFSSVADEESTIEEQELMEGEADHNAELVDLAKDGIFFLIPQNKEHD